MRRTIIFLLMLFLTSLAQDSAEEFLGRWALYLPGGAGWLSVTQNEGYLDAELLWYGGSVTPVDYVHVDNGKLVVLRTRRVVRERDEYNEPTRVHLQPNILELENYGDLLGGKMTAPHRDGKGIEITRFTGKAIPPLPPAPHLETLRFGTPVTLFNGKDLTGWVLTDKSRKNSFSVQEGVLVNDPPKGHGHPRSGNIRTVDEFEDFNLKMDVAVPQGSNSGIYLRGIYEVQILDSYGKDPDSHHMGAIYSRITPAVSAEKPAGEWQSFDITLCDRHVTVVLNGTTIIDNEPLLGVTGGALTANEFEPGPIYLQGDHGPVKFRNMILTPIIK